MKISFPGYIPLLALQIILIAACIKGLAQTVPSDSLRQAIAKHPDNMEKADLCIQVAKDLISHSLTDSAGIYCEKALNLSTRLEYIEGQADAYYILGIISKIAKDYKTAIDQIEKCIKLYVQINDTLKLAKGYYQLAQIFNATGKRDQFLVYSLKSLSHAREIENQMMIMANFNAIGSVYNDMMLYDSAAYYYLKSFEICKAANDTLNEALVLNNLGNVYFNNAKYLEAKEFYEQSLALNKMIGSESGEATNLNGLGRVAAELGNLDEALSIYLNAREIFELSGIQLEVAAVNNNIGDVYFIHKNYDSSLVYFTKALTFYADNQNIQGIVTTLLNVSAVYSETGFVDKAMKLQDSCLVLARNMGNVQLYSTALFNIADNYIRKGQPNEAYNFLIKYASIRDSVYKSGENKSLNVALLKYTNEKVTARNLALEKENLQRTNQRNAYMFSGIGILVLALFTIIYFRQKTRHDKFIAEQKIRQLEEEKKLMSARLLIEGQEEERKRIATELHDGLGVLLSAVRMQFSVLSGHITGNRDLIDKASKMLEQASGDVRKISHNMMPGLLTKLGFYEAVEDLFEQISDSGDLHAECIIRGEQERLPENKEIMLYRIVQEMVNNSLKHAKASSLQIIIGINSGRLDITYTDDGRGFNYNEKIENESLGLKSIQSRVSFLNGSLTVETSPGSGVKYALHIPV